MSVRSSHVPIDRLTALAFAGQAPSTEQDEQALRHASHCARCSAELARLTLEAESLREVAFARADAIFDDAVLEAQRTRILDRLANLGHAARVLRFPRRTRDAVMPVSTSGRRWISVAAAAGLIIGLVAGQMLHLVPWAGLGRRDASLTVQSSTRPATTGLVATSAPGSAITDDQFLDEIEAAVRLRRAHSLRALDALTPTAGDFRELPIPQR
jgi:hypothetical protein